MIEGYARNIGWCFARDAQEMESASRFRVGFYQPCSCRRPSYRTMPAAVAKFRLRTFPDTIGMVKEAERSSTSAGKPRVSGPNSRQSPERNGIRVYGVVAWALKAK